MSFVGELRGGDRFSPLALLDLGRGSVRRDLELELDQELHVLHPALPAARWNLGTSLVLR